MESRLLALALSLCGCAGTQATAPADNSSVYRAWANQTSGAEVTAAGSVSRFFGIRRTRGGLHEGFLVHLRGAEGHGLTIKVEDNVDLTGPIPLEQGDDVELRGEYVFNSMGGLVHWTHHDPRGRHIAGYVLVHGHRYQ